MERLPLEQSDIRAMTRECIKHSGINMGQGICQIPTPQVLKDAAAQAINQGKNTYTFAEGISDLRRAISAKIKRDNNVEANFETEIVVTAGTTGAFTSTLQALLNPGDGVVFFEPFYGYHVNTTRLAGLIPQFASLNPEDWSLSEKSLRAAITPSTRAIVLCTPSNPTGKILTHRELKLIGEIAEEFDLIVISDEIYEYFVYDDQKHISLLNLPEFKERAVTLMGFSKTFSITGWRLGYVVTKEAWAHRIKLASDLIYICAVTPFQYAVAEGLRKLPVEYYLDLRQDHQRKRDLFCQALVSAGFIPHVPAGAYYVFADLTRLGQSNSFETAMKLLELIQIAAIPGRAFFNQEPKEKYLRFCFGIEDDVLQEVCERFKTLG